MTWWQAPSSGMVCIYGIDVRCAIIRMISRKSGETSYPNVHDSKILKLEEQAQRATSGNDDAAEHIWRTLTELLANLGGFAVYLLLCLTPVGLSLASGHRFRSMEKGGRTV